MFVWLCILILFAANGSCKCVKNKIKLWSPVKCEAGRSFFARLDTISDFSKSEISQPYLYPWLSELVITHPDKVKFCTGALINDRYVLTAQSCFIPLLQPYHVTVRIGFYNGYDKDVSELFQPRLLERKATKILSHPEYNPSDPRSATNNLGLVKLEKPVKYSKTIFPVQLPTLGEKFVDYGNILAENVEWSFFPSQGTQSNKKFKDLTVKILDAQQCSNFNNNYKQIITPEVVCAVDIENDGKPCGEENGGLLLLSKPQRMYNVSVLIGITAWEPSNGETCQSSGFPRVYVRIADKLQWIKENTRDGLYCRY